MKLLTKIIETKDSQYWAITIGYNSATRLADYDFEVIAVSVFEKCRFVADITEMLHKLDLLEQIVDSIDWWEVYHEHQADNAELRADAEKEGEI